MGKSKELAELGQVVSQSGGNVGIGTSSPAQKVHVGGNIRVSSASENTIITNGANFTTGAVTDSALLYNSGSLLFGNGITERLRIDSSGRVTMPYQPAFRAELNQNASFTTAYQIAPFGTVVFNRGGHYNPSTKGFTAPVGGVYSFTIRVRLFSVSNYFYGWFRVNGVDVDYYHTAQNVGDYQSFEATSVLNLNANDVVQVTIRANSNVGYADAGAASQFSGYLLG